MKYSEAFDLVVRKFPGAKIDTSGFEGPEFFVVPPFDEGAEGFPPYIVWKSTKIVEAVSIQDRRLDEWAPLFITNRVSV